MNSATDCPNIGTKHCQVPKKDCYAFKAETHYPQPLDYRRRQQIIWDCLDAETWAKAFLMIVSRKKNAVDALRLSEAGDFRHRGDIVKANQISKYLSEADIHVYTYSASDYLEWELATDFLVNASNDHSEYGDQRYIAVESKSDIPDEGIHCPHDATNGQIDCGECMACITGVPGNVYITMH